MQLFFTLLTLLGFVVPPAQVLPPPKKPPVLHVSPAPTGGMLITWEDTGNLGADNTLYFSRLRPGQQPLVLVSSISSHNPPFAGHVDSQGTLCDGYELRLTGGVAWRVVAPSRCHIGLPVVRSP